MRPGQPLEHEDKNAEKLDSGAKHSVGKASGESLDGLEGHTQKQKASLDKERSDRDQSLDSHLKKNGKAKIGIITKQFGCSIELKEGDKTVVKGRSTEEVSRARAEMEKLKTAADSGLLIGEGGKFSPAKGEKQITDAAAAALKNVLGDANTHLKIPKVESKNDQWGQIVQNVAAFTENVTHLGQDHSAQARGQQHGDDAGKNKVEARKEINDKARPTPKEAEDSHAREKANFLHLLKDHAAEKAAQGKDSKIDAAQEKRIEKNVADFEKRENDLTDTYKKQFLHDEQWLRDHKNLSPEQRNAEASKDAHVQAETQMAETYKHLSELLKGTGKSPEHLSQKQRQDLCEQITQRAAHPELIAQGDFDTCQITCMERRAFARTPAEAARLISEVALKGEYQSTHSQTKIKIDPQHIQGDGDKNTYPKDGERCFADHIFIETAANIALKPKGLSYDQNQLRDQNGRAMYIGNESSRHFGSNPNLANEDLYKIDAEICSKPGEKPQTGWIFAGPTKYKEFVESCNSPEDMAKKMAAALDEGKGPLVLNVFMGPGATSPHDLTVDSYYKAAGSNALPLFNLDNNWTKEQDINKESPYDLYKSLLYKNEFPATADGGHKYFENIQNTLIALENQHNSGALSNEAYDDAILSQLSAYNTVRVANLANIDDKSRKAVSLHLKNIMLSLKRGKAHDAIYSDGLWHER